MIADEMTTPNTAKARSSCSRCYKRKKRCDRSLPTCKNCHDAHVRCSFLDDDRQTAAYSVSYVRNLERRVREMEKGISMPSPANALSSPRHADMSMFNSHDDSTLHGSEHTTVDMSWDSGAFQPQTLTGPVVHHSAHSMPLAQSQMAQTSPHTVQPEAASPPSFVQELKSLSFEATAERHLGSSSGLSFARLTQTVLRRLMPDLTDFVFLNGPGNNSAGARLFEFDNASPMDLSDPTLLESLNTSISVHPMFFGDLILSNSPDPDTSGAICLGLPNDEAHVNHLVDFYFAHSHTLYPIIHRGQLLQSLQTLRQDPNNLSGQSPLSLFRIWMVLAIGSTAYSSVSLLEESESRGYYNKALEYLEQAMTCGEMAALEAITLQVSYSFFNQVGPNTWYLVGLAARLAVGMGLHTESSYDNLPIATQQIRKRIFFSIYMMDRVVSNALGRPFAIHDDDIDVTPFVDISDDDDIPTEDLNPCLKKPSLIAIPLHILALRRIASKIARQVYSNRKTSTLTVEQREEIIQALHKELIDWRRNMPFPLPDVNDRVPQLTSNWFDFNFYVHLAMLYRPSPLLPVMDSKRVKTLHEAASMSLRQASSMHQQRRFAYNWLNLLSIFTSTLSLIYSTTVQPNDLGTVLKESRAISDLDLAMELFDTLGMKFAAANKIRGMIAEVSKRYKSLRDSDSRSITAQLSL